MRWLVLVGLAGGCHHPVDGDIDVSDAGNLDAYRRCDPLRQDVCRADQKCGWLSDQVNPSIGHIDCAPNATVEEGGACTYGVPGPMGFSTCVRGTECFGGVCERICDYQGGQPACDAGFHCQIHYGFLEDGIVVAGLCER